MPRVLVKELQVQCSYKIRNLNEPNMAMSDCCQTHAEYVVEDSKGNKMYRCYDHRWMLSRDFTSGYSSKYVTIKDRK